MSTAVHRIGVIGFYAWNASRETDRYDFSQRYLILSHQVESLKGVVVTSNLAQDDTQLILESGLSDFEGQREGQANVKDQIMS